MASAAATELQLNQIVKGAPATTATANVAAAAAADTSPDSAAAADAIAADVAAALPSSPPAIYLNLLILESSLRSQYLHLLSRRRLNMFFVLLLTVWNVSFTWALFLRPREDGQGHGGSVYWMVEAFQKVALMGGAVAALLIWATGQWERGVRWPRKWLATTNRGLREFNLRVVVVKRRWYRELLGHLAFLLPLGLLWSDDTGGFEDWHLVENEATGAVVEDDLAVGGDHIILLLLPKAFGPAFREAWEEYRAAYWERENGRRAALRRQLKTLHRKRARDLGGWKWWTGLWRLLAHRRSHRRSADLEKQHHHPSAATNRNSIAAGTPLLTATSTAATSHRRRSLRRSESRSHSRQSSRSSTPQSANFDLDGSPEQALADRVRRGSSVSSISSTASSGRRKKRDTPLSLSMTSSDAAAAGDGGAPERPRRKTGGGGGGGAAAAAAAAAATAARPATPSEEAT